MKPFCESVVDFAVLSDALLSKLISDEIRVGDSSGVLK